MDVVGGGIVVLDLDGLAGHHTENVGMILAAALVEYDWVFGNVEGPASESVFHVDEHVGEITAGHDHILGFVRALAAWVLAHVNLRGLGSRAIKLHGAADRGNG